MGHQYKQICSNWFEICSVTNQKKTLAWIVNNRRITNVLIVSGAHAQDEFILIRDLGPSSLKQEAPSPQQGPAFIRLQLAACFICILLGAFQGHTGYRIFMFSLKSPSNA